MRVLHLCPLWFPVARDSPGGIETFITALLPELARLGCENTLLASADSRAEGALIPVVERSIVAGMETGEVWEYGPYQQQQLLLALERADEFDVVHSSVGWAAYVLSGVAGLRSKLLHTLHHPVTPDLEWFTARHPDMLVSTVSDRQARRLQSHGARRCKVIPNAIDLREFDFASPSGDRLVYVGRMEAEKGPDIAVRLARRLGRPLTLAGPMTDPEYFEAEIRPWLDDRIRYVGVADHRHKNELFGGASCALMPSRWEEPFGLVALEAMACGTPVVALRSGALPEIVEDGLTGFVGDDEDELADLASRAPALDRATVRSRVSERFDISAVARRYVGLYREIVDGASPSG